MVWIGVTMLLCATLGLSAKVPKTMTDKEFLEFYKDLKTKGVKLKRYENKGYGVAVTKDISEGGIVLCVDQDVIITANDRFALSDYIEDLSRVLKLKVRVLYEKFMAKRGEFNTEYVHSLSNEIFHLGSLTSDQFDYFSEVNLYYDVEDLLDKSDYDLVKEALKDVAAVPSKMLSYSSFLWASSTVNSRFFNYEFEDDDYTTVPALIPMLDFPNHHPNQRKYKYASFGFKTMGNYCLKSNWPLKKGEEYVIDYAKHDAFTFLRDYGIVLDYNPYDYAVFVYNGTTELKDNSFYLSADEVNTQLLEAYTYDLGNKVPISEIFRKAWKKSNDFNKKTIVGGLFLYKKEVDHYFQNITEIGLRKLRRETKSQKDSTMKYIGRYGCSIRSTIYNHQRALDREILFTLASLLHLS